MCPPTNNPPSPSCLRRRSHTLSVDEVSGHNYCRNKQEVQLRPVSSINHRTCMSSDYENIKINLIIRMKNASWNDHLFNPLSTAINGGGVGCVNGPCCQLSACVIWYIVQTFLDENGFTCTRSKAMGHRRLSLCERKRKKKASLWRLFNIKTQSL